MNRSNAEVLVRMFAALAADLRGRLKYCGQYSQGRDYRAGNFVSHAGSVWHCDRDCKDVTPAVDSECWTIAVKGKSA